jgi:predicted outer membrane protein
VQARANARICAPATRRIRQRRAHASGIIQVRVGLSLAFVQANFKPKGKPAMKIRALAIISALALPTVAFADDPKPSDADATKATASDTTNATGKTDKLSDGDAKIVAHLHHVNQMEIDLGKTAQKSGTSAVKPYATTLVSDHQSSDKDLTAFAKTHKMGSIPADKPMTDSDKQDQKEMQGMVSHLKTLKGTDFDNAFLAMMVSGHDKELANIDTSISAASDPDLQSMLKSVKPVLQRHSDQARDLQKGPQASTNPSTSSTPASR